jgi:hypothetical protein
MSCRLQVLAPHLQAPAESWAPRESFSPTLLATYAGADGCKRKAAFGAIFGVRVKGSSISKILGSLIHASLEHYLQGRTVYDLVSKDGFLRVEGKLRAEIDAAGLSPEKLAELAAEAPRRAVAGLHLLPNMNDPALERVEVEQWINIDTRRLLPDVEPLRITGKIDLSMRRAGVWYLYDHKSTKGRREKGKPFDPWAYCKAPDDLTRDAQGVLYGLDRVLKHSLPSIWSRWIYYLTDQKAHPDAKAVDVELDWPTLEREGRAWLLVAAEIRELMRAQKRGALTPDDVPPAAVLPPDPASPCNAFGGCPYHISKGGPCRPSPQVKLSDLILTGALPGKEEVEDMSLAQAYANASGAVAGAPQVPPTAGGINPPEGAAPAAPQLPAGWEYGPNGQPRACAPAGWIYNEAGQVVPAPPPAPPAPPAVQTAAGVAPEADAAIRDGGKGKGRPKGSKNKPKEGESELAAEIGELAEAMTKHGVEQVDIDPATGRVKSVKLFFSSLNKDDE